VNVLSGIRSRVPVGVRHRVARARLRYRVPTGRFRARPDALVIGAQRSGTSSLYRYLGRHPGVAPSFRKEVEYFSRYYNRGIDWYRAHFELEAGRRHLRFEATPDYLFHPLAAARAAETLPEARLVVLLRDPVARAWSHYQHMVDLGFESLTFEAALDTEADRCDPDLAALAADPDHDAKSLLRYSYLARGRYAEQLERWLAVFPREQLLVIRSEDFFRDTKAAFGRIVDFLGLADWAPPTFTNESRLQGRPSATGLPPAAEARLREAFTEPNERLVDVLGADAPRW
jgi:hypothetical protein